jgi:predicted transcriptional regulator
LDAEPAVMVWLLCLDDKDRRSMRDDVTPAFKEVATEPRHFERMRDDDVDEAEERLSDDVLDEARAALRGAPQDELFPEMGVGPRGLIMRAARAQMPDWQFRAFVAWFRGTNRARIARTLGVSRSTVRSALDGEGKRGGAGAIAEFMNAILRDDEFRKVVMTVATKSISKANERAAKRSLGWFKGWDHKPDMVVALSLLMVADDLADERREVPVAALHPHFPPRLISPCLRLLAAHGFASSNGHLVRVVKTPGQLKESA